MSEQPISFMASVDLWSEASVIGPLLYLGPKDGDSDAVITQVKKAIRTKVLESYRNGQAAGPRTQQQRRPYAKR